MRFSIVIPLRKINDYLREAMPYFQKQTYKNFEIIVVSEHHEEERFPKTKIVKVGQIPPSGKRNMGVKNSKGDIIAFIDDDAYPEEDWLEKAAKEFEDKEIVAIGGPSLPPKNSTFFQRVSNKVYELSSKKTGMRYSKKKRKEIDDWPTCNLFVRKKNFNKTKGFDEEYWGGEDTQLCYDILKTEGKMFFNPEISIYHHPRKDLTSHLRQSFFWGMWRGFFMRKHKESRQLTFFIPALFVLWLFFGGFLTFFNEIFGWIYLFSIMLYFLFSMIKGFQTRSIKLFLPVMFVMFLTQLIYGVGFLRGILSKKAPIKRTLNPAEKLVIKK
jgi:GT2 family glycosyltransferase